MKKLILLVLISLTLRLVFFDSSYFFWDESIYMMHAKLYAGQSVGYSETEFRPPLVPIIQSVIYKISSQNFETTSKLLMILLNSLIVFPVYFLGKKIDDNTGFLAALIMALFPSSIMFSRQVMTDHLAMVLILGSVTALLYKRYITTGILMSLSILTKYTSLIVLPLLLPLLFDIKILVSVLSFGFTLLPILISNFIAYANPFHSFLMAWQVVSDKWTVTPSFILYLFNDMFSLFFIFAFIGCYFAYKKKYLIYMFVFLIFYSSLILQKGVARPTGLEWEVERIILPLLPFVAILSSYASVRLLKKRSYYILFIFILMTSQYIRAYTPAIEFEDGLRYVTKEVATKIDNEFACIGNCPPVAYYSGQILHQYYDLEEFKNSDYSLKVSFTDIGNETEK